MSTLRPSLHSFIESVPYCPQTERLEAVRSIFRQGNCDRVVVVNEQQQPVGLVYLHSLMGTPATVSQRSSPWRQPLGTLSFPWIAPLTPVPASLSLSEFWLYLQDQHWQDVLHAPTPNPEFHYLAETVETASVRSEQNRPVSASDFLLQDSLDSIPAHATAPDRSPPIALINEAGQFMGLLDSLQLLKFVALHTHLNLEESCREREMADCRPPTSASEVAPHAERRPPEPPSLASEAYDSLAQLLEQLPLPLRVQTNTGEIVSQNEAWRSFVGNGPEPVKETVCATSRRSSFPYSVADFSVPNPAPSNRGVATLVEESDSDSSPHALHSLTPPLNFPGTAGGWCTRTAKPDTYICVSPVHKGQERVWQFVKQPLAESITLVLGQDVTEEYLVTRELITKNADLIQLNRLKDEFLACISHELKTPLTAILGLSSLLKDQVIGNLNDRQARYTKLIHQSGRHLMTVVNDILDLTRMETGQLELLPEPVQLAQVCQRAFEQALRLQQPEDKPSTPGQAAPTDDHDQKADFSLEIEPGLPQMVADELRLRQMLVHLLSNALKFTESGGKLGLKVNRWEGWIAFTVWDTGIGIPADKQHLIFQKFQQLESPLTRRFAGTGLGLVLTQRLARLHGGDVSFISSQGAGSQFTLLLPPVPPGKNQISVPRVEAEEPMAGASCPISDCLCPLSPRSRLVLIVEAVPRFVEELTHLLTGLGYRVLVARAGTEALEKARRFAPEVIFLNPLLPLLSGWDVLTLLKTDAETRSIPVVVTATRGEKERAALNQADGFLSLPVKESALRQQLEKLTTQSQPSAKGDWGPLTVLWLSPHNTCHASSFLLEASQCQIIEADDLDQAEMLARIWQPQVILLEGVDRLEDPQTFLEQLSHRNTLAMLPVVTLDPATTQVANGVKGLSVFPCLVAGVWDKTETYTVEVPGSPAHSKSFQTPQRVITPALLQVLQVAVGMSLKPCILLADTSTLPDLVYPATGWRQSASGRGRSVQFPMPNSPLWVPNSQALIQYLQTAGFRGTVGRSWAEILQQLQYQSVDLLLICLREPLPAEVIQALLGLEQVPLKPPILVLDYRSGDRSETELVDLALRKISATILPISASIAELLKQIETTLKG